MKSVSEKIEQHLILDIASAFAPVGVLECDKNGNPSGIRFPDQCCGEATIRLRVAGNVLLVMPDWPMSKLPQNSHNYSTTVTPHDLYDGSGGEGSTILISTTKAPVAIVKEIMRRYLKTYLPVLAKCIAKRDANDKYTVDSKNAFDTVKNAASIGPVLSKRNASYGNIVAIPEGDLAVHNSDSVTATLRLTLANTLKLIEFLKTLS